MVQENAEVDKVQAARKITQALQSDNKKTRKQSLIDLQTYLSCSAGEQDTFTNQELRNIFTETQIHTLNAFRDKTETVREQAIKFMHFLIVDKLPLNDFYLTYVFPVLVERIGSMELVEESEEIRLALLQFLSDIITRYSNTEQLKPFLGDSVIVLCEIVKDKHPAIKELACKVVQDLAGALPRDFHMQAESLTKPLLTCFPHQRYRVRVEAIKAIGVVVMHSSYNALNETVGPLAERLFDQVPLVRRTVAQVAATWLLEYRDRYSFFHKILPLLLTGLNDEVQETRDESHKMWEQVGLQYQQENEKDLKDQLDFLLQPPKYYPLHLKRPNLGCRVLVQRHVGKLTSAIAYELTCWQEDVRVRCAQLLCALVLLAEDGITQHLQDLLPAMYSAARDDDHRVVDNIRQASEILGLFVRTKAWFKLLLPAIQMGVHYGHLIVLTGFIKGTPSEYMSYESLYQITKVISDDLVCSTRKTKNQIELMHCVGSICEKYPRQWDLSKDQEVGYHLFKMTVTTMALKDDATNLIENLGVLTDTLSKERDWEVWDIFLGRLLDQHVGKEPASWTVTTPERCVFDVVLLESAEAFGSHLDQIATILVDCLDPAVDPESRLKTFWALSTTFDNKSVIFKMAPGDQLARFFERLITDVFVPSLVWHAGATAEALRTMAASCLLCALTDTPPTFSAIDHDLFRSLVDRLLPLLLSLMEDASYSSRSLAVRCVTVLKRHAVDRRAWTCDDLLKVYPELLKRLDDPTDKVRRCCLGVLREIFGDFPPEFAEVHYNAHHELIVDTLMTHFDDDEEEVQRQVFGVASINRQMVCSKVRRHRPLVCNQEGCDRLLDELEG